MKKTLIALMMCSPIVCAAQSEWEAPTTAAKETKAQSKTTKQAANAASAATPSDAAAMNIKDWKYIKEGAVPEVDGKIVFARDIAIDGKDAQQIYDRTYVALDSLTNDKNQINSSIALINRKEHSIVARCQEWLEFNRSFLALDRTKFSYVVVARCTDGHLNLSLERLAYNYEEGRATELKTTAEKWIADKYAVNKKRTKLTPGSAKFRKKTIDRANEIFKQIETAVK